jgi:DNA-3-methyladenine glycosylase II
MPALRCRIDLPPGFRNADVLAFHRRDAQAVGERVEAEALHKGLLWEGHPACLSVRFTDARADAELQLDGIAGPDDVPRLAALLRRMLGLTQPVEAFEAAYRTHPQLGRLLAARPGLRVPVAPTPFEALTWAVTGQQISVHAAVAIRRKLILRAGRPHSGGLWCYPDAAGVAALDEEALRAAGFSQGKAATLLALSRQVLAGELPLDAWAAQDVAALPAEEIRQRLQAVRGIGPWTINYGLLRGFGWVDGSLHGDVAVRRNLQLLLGSAEAVGEKAAQAWLAEFSPWRALVAAHLWAMPATG